MLEIALRLAHDVLFVGSSTKKQPVALTHHRGEPRKREPDPAGVSTCLVIDRAARAVAKTSMKKTKQRSGWNTDKEKIAVTVRGAGQRSPRTSATPNSSSALAAARPSGRPFAHESTIIASLLNPSTPEPHSSASPGRSGQVAS